MKPHAARRAKLLGVILAVGACGAPSEPTPPLRLEFSPTELDLGTERSGEVEVRNTGGGALGPVDILTGAVQDAAGGSVPGTRVVPEITRIPTLDPGDARALSLSLSLPSTLAPGSYDAVVRARAGSDAEATLVVRFQVLDEIAAAAATVTLDTQAADVRQGDVIGFMVEVRDAAGELLHGASVAWSVLPGRMGFVGENGQFVGYEAGAARLVARVGAAADTVALTISPRGLTGEFRVAAEGVESRRFTSDLWLFGDYAYTGTWGVRQSDAGTFTGNALYTWDIRGAPQKVATLTVDARTVNDVKVRADGKLAVMTHEGSNDGLNGVTILDLSDPARPTAVGRFTAGLEPGVHNVWVEDDYVYVAVDGMGGGLRVLDISEPSAPEVVASFYAGSSFLHDVYVRDGLAFLSHWNAGLVILDVGNGIAGGTPERPREVSRLTDLGGETHNAWYWPEAGYAFVGEEDFGTPGVMHVVDVRNMAVPREVATFGVPGQTPHNFWLDEDRGVLYLAWYGNGIRALDVSGDLLGELDRQGREIAGFRYHGGQGECDRGSTATCTWAPQLHRGLVWVSDMNQGLIGLTPP